MIVAARALWSAGIAGAVGTWSVGIAGFVGALWSAGPDLIAGITWALGARPGGIARALWAFGITRALGARWAFGIAGALGARPVGADLIAGIARALGALWAFDIARALGADMISGIKWWLRARSA